MPTPGVTFTDEEKDELQRELERAALAAIAKEDAEMVERGADQPLPPPPQETPPPAEAAPAEPAPASPQQARPEPEPTPQPSAESRRPITEEDLELGEPMTIELGEAEILRQGPPELATEEQTFSQPPSPRSGSATSSFPVGRMGFDRIGRHMKPSSGEAEPEVDPQKSALQQMQSPESDEELMARLRREAGPGVGDIISGLTGSVLTPRRQLQQNAAQRQQQRQQMLNRFAQIRRQQQAQRQQAAQQEQRQQMLQRDDARYADKLALQREQMGMRAEEQAASRALRERQLGISEAQAEDRARLIDAQVQKLQQASATDEERRDPDSAISQQARDAYRAVAGSLNLPLPENFDTFTAYQIEDYLNEQAQSYSKLRSNRRGGSMGPTTAQRQRSQGLGMQSAAEVLVRSGEWDDVGSAADFLEGLPPKVRRDYVKELAVGGVKFNRQRELADERAVASLGRDLAPLTPTTDAMKRLYGILRTLTPEEIASLQLKNVAEGYTPKGAMTPRARRASELFNKLRAAMAKMRSGAAVSAQEFARISDELGTSITAPQDIIPSIQSAIKAQEEELARVYGSYSPDVQSAFLRQRADAMRRLKEQGMGNLTADRITDTRRQRSTRARESGGGGGFPRAVTIVGSDGQVKARKRVASQDELSRLQSVAERNGDEVR